MRTLVSGEIDLPRLVNSYPVASRAALVLVLLVMASVISSADLQIFALLATSIKVDLRLSDSQLGILQGFGLYLTQGLVSIPLGIFIDRFNRMRFFACIALGWGVSTALCASAENFIGLLACRIGVGVAEAGLYTAAYSVIADLYPPRKQSMAIFAFFVAVLVGGGVATVASGWLIGEIDTHASAAVFSLDRLPPWRLTFLIASVPALILAVLFLAAKEPSRQDHFAQDAPTATPVRLVTYLRANKGPLLKVCVAMFLNLIAFQSLVFWMPTILHRSFGLSEGQAGEIFGLTFVCGPIGGVGIATAFTRALRRLGPELTPFYVLRIGLWGSALILPLYLFVHDISSLVVLWSVHCAMIYISLPLGPNLVTIITPGHLRGRVLTIYNFGLVLSASIAPPIVGVISDKLLQAANGLVLASCLIGIPCSFLALFVVGRPPLPTASVKRREGVSGDRSDTNPGMVDRNNHS